MDRGGEWTEVVSRQTWLVDRRCEWTEVVNDQRWRVDRGGEWTEVVTWKMCHTVPPQQIDVEKQWNIKTNGSIETCIILYQHAYPEKTDIL